VQGATEARARDELSNLRDRWNRCHWDNSRDPRRAGYEAISHRSRKTEYGAQRFSTSAAQISAGIQDAVAKLNVQANANQTMALAANTANSNSLEADRPWMGGTLNVADFAVGKTPTYTVSFMNSGKRPAKVTLTQTLDAARDFGNNPTYAAYDTTPSMSFVVPGQGLAFFDRTDFLYHGE
jgi:hypothetical protein